MAETTNKLQVMTLDNLQKYDGLLKGYIDSACAVVDGKSIKTVALVDGKLNFYDVVEPVGTTTPKYSITLPKEDLSGLMEKLPSNVVAGTVVVADGNGGVKAAAFKEDEVALKADVNASIAGVQGEVDAIKGDYLKAADKTELEGKIKVNTDAIAVLNGTGDGSVKKAVDEAINKFATDVTNDEVVNSYKELIDWAAEHGGEAAEMAEGIQANADAIKEVKDLVGELPADATEDTVVEHLAAKVLAEENRATAKENELAGAIDTAKGEALTAASNAETNAKAHADAEVAKDRARLDAVEADVAEIETSLAAGGATANAIAAAHAAGTAAQGTADQALEKANTNAGDISGLKERMTKAEGDISGLQGELSTAKGNLSSVTDRVTQAEKDIDALEETVKNIQENAYDDTELRGLVSANAGEITKLKEKDNEIAGKVSTIEGNLSSVTDRVSAEEGKVATLQGEMTTAKGDIADLKTASGTHGTDIEGLKGRMTTAEGKVSTLEGTVANHGERLTTAEGNITTLQTTAASHNDRITALEANPVVEAIPDSAIAALFTDTVVTP